MTRTLESHLRDALAARAQEIPDAPAERLRGHDYRPRTRDLRPPVAAGAVLTAGAAAAAVLIVGLGPRAPAAFAGWTAKPKAVAASQTDGAVAGCAQRLAAIPTSPAARNVARATGHPMSLPTVGALTPVLSDVRGPFTFIVFANADASATASCITGPGFTSASEDRSVGPQPAVATNGISVTWVAHTARAGQAYSFLEGHAGAAVTAVTLDLADGSTVQTTTDNGWFVAWWPGSVSAASATVTTAQGTSTATLPAPAVTAGPPAPAGGSVSCAGGVGSAGGAGAAAGSMSQSGPGGTGTAPGTMSQSGSGS
jgi:hypothetical protein